MIQVIDYDRRWPDRFARLETVLSAALRAASVPFVSIEHVGSTSVPGLAAKPIIDADVVVQRGDVASATAALEAVGFRSIGDLGIPERFAFEAPPALGSTNVYVVVDGSLALRNHRAVRDVLRARPDLREAYGNAKRDAATVAVDIDDYGERKSAVLRQILRTGGLDEEELDEIEQINLR